jgi:ABC-type antimicrobial peptide transport system permease subunit
MRKILFSIFGAVLAGIICNILFWVVGRLAIALDIRLFNSEEESSRNFLIFLVIFFISIVAGCIYGYYIANKLNKNT